MTTINIQYKVNKPSKFNGKLTQPLLNSYENGKATTPTPTMEKRVFLGACQDGDVTKVAYLLHTKLVDVNSNDKHPAGHTGLHWAANGGKTCVMRTLLRHGADINKRNFYGETPLCRAINQWELDAVKLLLVKNARLENIDIHSKSAMGQVPIMKIMEESKGTKPMRTRTVKQIIIDEILETITKKGAKQEPLKHYYKLCAAIIKNDFQSVNSPT